MQRPQQEIHDLVSSLRWTEICSRDFPKCRHVNIQEAAAVLNELKRLVHQGGWLDSHRVACCDSRVTEGAWAKGRSCSLALNRVLQQSLAWFLLGRIRMLPL